MTWWQVSGCFLRAAALTCPQTHTNVLKMQTHSVALTLSDWTVHTPSWLTCTQRHIPHVQVWNMQPVLAHPLGLLPLCHCPWVLSVHLRWPGGALTGRHHALLPHTHSPSDLEWDTMWGLLCLAHHVMGLVMSSLPGPGSRGCLIWPPGSNHSTEVEVMATCLYPAHLRKWVASKWTCICRES